MSAEKLITEHLDLWTGAIASRSSSGRGSRSKIELAGIKKLRDLILELAIRGKLVAQDENDSPSDLLFEKIESAMSAQLKAKAVRKPKTLPDVQEIEQPFPIPDSWRYCRLNDVGIWGSGATPNRGNARYYGGNIPWFKSGELCKDFIDSSEEKITDLAVQETSVRMNQPGDVLIAMYGATIGKASILEVEGTTNQAVCACTPWPGISIRFLLILLKAYRSRFIAMGAGGAQPNISREKIIATAIGLPPEQEQHRIVEKVDELMALCDRLEQQTSDQLEAHEALVDTLLGTLTQSENATDLADNWARLAAHFDTLFTTEQSIDKLKQTILQLAVMGRLVEQDANEESALELLAKLHSAKTALTNEGKLKNSRGPREPNDNIDHISLPTGWELARLEDVYDVRDGTHDSPKYQQSGYPLVTSKNLSSGELTFEDIKFISESDHQKIQERSRVHKGDILFAMIGSIGNPVIVNTDREFSIKNVALFKHYSSKLSNPYFLKLFLEVAAGELKQEAAGGVQSFVSLGKLRSWLIPLPPLSEQQRIVAKASELFYLCDQLKKRLNQASETRCQLADAIVEGALH